MGHEPAGDRMEDFIEDLIPNLLRAGQVDKGQGKPFPQHRQMTRPKDPKSHLSHSMNFGLDQFRVVVGAGAVGTGDKDH